MRLLDADVVIGFLDPGDAHHRRAVSLISDALEADEQLAMSASGYSEVLVHALHAGRGDVVDGFIDDARIAILPVDRDVAHDAARLRAEHGALRLPDALVLASSLRNDAELATFDRRLRRVAEAVRRSR